MYIYIYIPNNAFPIITCSVFLTCLYDYTLSHISSSRHHRQHNSTCYLVQ